MNLGPSLALREIRTLDHTSVLTGRCTRSMGASVIKIEPLQGGEARQMGAGLHPGTFA